MNAKPRVDRGVTQAIRSCDRPGCYEQFLPRSPRQKFCSKECQRAMERVWERERRWREPGTGQRLQENGCGLEIAVGESMFTLMVDDLSWTRAEVHQVGK